MDFVLPTISIDFSWFAGLGSQPLWYIMWVLFIYGGWVPVLIALWKGGQLIWLNWRQGKFAQDIDYILLAMDVPKGDEQTPKAVENIFTHLNGTYSGPTLKEKWWDGKIQITFSFELISIGGYIQFLVRTPTKHRDLIEAAIFSQYPDAEIIEVEDYTKDAPKDFPDEKYTMTGTEFVTKKNLAYPIKTYPQFEHTLSMEFKDPLAIILESLSRLKKGEQVWLQILVSPSKDGWKVEAQKEIDKKLGRKPKQKESLIQKVGGVPKFVLSEFASQIFRPSEPAKPVNKKEESKVDLSPGERKDIEAMQLKLQKPGLNTKYRFIYLAEHQAARIGPIFSIMKGSIGQFTIQTLNGLGGYGPVTPSGDYFWQKEKIFEYLSLGFYKTMETKRADIMRAYKNRDFGVGASPYVLSVEELATLYHFPSINIKAPLVKRTESKRAEPPFTLPTKE